MDAGKCYEMPENSPDGKYHESINAFTESIEAGGNTKIAF